jgi:hypothetical protein
MMALVYLPPRVFVKQQTAKKFNRKNEHIAVYVSKRKSRIERQFHRSQLSRPAMQSRSKANIPNKKSPHPRQAGMRAFSYSFSNTK